MAEISFGTYEAEDKVNPYADVVRQLSEFNDENKSVTLTVDVNEVSKEQFKFQRAANDIFKTARLRRRIEDNVVQTGTDEDGNPIREGNVSLIFTLTKMHKGRRGPRKNVESEALNSDGDNSAPEEVSDEVVDEATDSTDNDSTPKPRRR